MSGFLPLWPTSNDSETYGQIDIASSDLRPPRQGDCWFIYRFPLDRPLEAYWKEFPQSARLRYQTEVRMPTVTSIGLLFAVTYDLLNFTNKPVAARMTPAHAVTICLFPKPGAFPNPKTSAKREANKSTIPLKNIAIAYILLGSMSIPFLLSHIHSFHLRRMQKVCKISHLKCII